MSWIKVNLEKFRRFATANEGVAAVEFALILPFLMVLYMGSLEVSQIVSVDRKMSAVVGALGDLVSRTDGDLATATLADYFTAVGLIMTPYSAGSLKQLVTLVYVDDNGDTNVEWSVGYNGATAKTANTTYAIPSELIAIAADTYIVVSEAQLPYQPWGGYVFDTSINLYQQYFYFSRFDADIPLI